MNTVNQSIPKIAPLPEKLKGFDWAQVLSVYDPKGNRPRRLSLHSIATVCAREPLTIAAEMRATGEVLGYTCPDVQTPIFYLKDLRSIMIDTANPNVWGNLPKFVEKNPWPAVKGFKRFPSDGKYAMAVPFEPADKPYETALLAHMAEWRKGKK